MHNPPLQHYIDQLTDDAIYMARRRFAQGQPEHARLRQAHAMAQQLNGSLSVNIQPTALGLTIVMVDGLDEARRRITAAGLKIIKIDDAPINTRATAHHIEVDGLDYRIVAHTFRSAA